MGNIDTSFSGLMGSSPTVKVWEYLMIGREYAYNMSDIAKGAGVSRPKVYSIIRCLMKKGVVIIDGKQGGSTFYRLNKKSEYVKPMLSAFKKLLKV